MLQNFDPLQIPNSHLFHVQRQISQTEKSRPKCDVTTGDVYSQHYVRRSKFRDAHNHIAPLHTVSFIRSSLKISPTVINQPNLQTIRLPLNSTSSRRNQRACSAYRWHHVRVAVADGGHVIVATLDDVTERMSAGREKSRLRLPPSVYYGGMDVSANTFGWHFLT